MLKTLRQQKRGQGLVEFTLMFPVLLVMLSGLMEFGFLLNEYLDILDAAREAARFASDNDPFNEDYTDRQVFYDTAADLAMSTMRPLEICIDDDPMDGLRCGDDVNDTIHGCLRGASSVAGKMKHKNAISVVKFGYYLVQFCRWNHLASDKLDIAEFAFYFGKMFFEPCYFLFWSRQINSAGSSYINLINFYNGKFRRPLFAITCHCRATS